MIIADIAIHLGPRATQMFNISNIIMNQVPDADGNIIPASVQSGSAKLMGSLAIHQHILVAMEASSYNVSKATCWVYCLTCDGYTWGWLEASPFGVVVGGQTQENFYAYWDDDYEEDLTSDANQNQWTSGNTGVLRVTNSGVVSGAGAGSAWLDAYNPVEPVYVNQDCSEEYWMCPETYGTGGSGSGTAGDPTPSINSISPLGWPAGSTTFVTITGTGFGTNPIVQLSDPGIGWQLFSATDDGGVGGATIEGSVTVPLCRPSEGVELDVTSQGYNGLGFIPVSPGQSPTSPNFGVVVEPLAAVVPSISFGGNIISGTQSVVTGQQIALTGNVPSPQNLCLVSQSWSAPTGTAIGGATASNTSGFTLASLPGTNTGNYGPFYWVSGGTFNISFQYSLSNGNTSPATTSTFSVSAATVSNMNTPTGHVGIFAGPVLGFGPIGISFNPTVSTPSGSAGALEWVQLITNDSYTLTPISGSKQTCTDETQPATSAGTGLDTEYPYARSSSTQDSPTIALNSSTYAEEARSFSATMYLLWDPALPSGCVPGSNCNSIPVPLGYVTWGWSGDASFSGGNWSLTSSSSTTPSWVASTSYPSWSDFVPFTGLLCH